MTGAALGPPSPAGITGSGHGRPLQAIVASRNSECDSIVVHDRVGMFVVVIVGVVAVSVRGVRRTLRPDSLHDPTPQRQVRRGPDPGASGLGVPETRFVGVLV